MMPNAKITYFFLIFQTLVLESKLDHRKSSFFTRLAVNYSPLSSHQTLLAGDKEIRQVLSVGSDNNYRCKYKCGNGNVTLPRNVGQTLFEIFTGNDNDISDSNKVTEERPSGKSAEFNLMSDDDDDDDDENDRDDADDDNDCIDEMEKETEEDEESENKNESDFLGESKKKSKATKKKKKDDDDGDDDDDPPEIKHIKHIFKPKIKIKHLMFFLLLAYKIKLATLIPLFLGAKILLAGATAMAGFFFALFAAAIGLQNKSHHR